MVFYCYVRCVTLTIKVGEMPWLKTGVFYYHAQLELPDKGRAIKRVVCLLDVTQHNSPGLDRKEV